MDQPTGTRKAAIATVVLLSCGCLPGCFTPALWRDTDAPVTARSEGGLPTVAKAVLTPITVALDAATFAAWIWVALSDDDDDWLDG